MDYYLAIDIGASSGRHILGHLEDGRLRLEEIHRFHNSAVSKRGRLRWDTERLFEEVLTGLRKCRSLGKIPASLGIDTWGVDYALLDEAGKVIGDTVAYRDHRTDGMDAALNRIIGEEELYARTGIQKQPFNTIYQFLAVQREHPGRLESAADFLLMPEYLSFLLTGNRLHEYTNSTTTGLVSLETKTWDDELIRRCGFPARLFADIAPPGTSAGRLRPAIAEELGFGCEVVLPASHDTASAVLSAPLSGRATEGLSGRAAEDIDGDSLFLSSGTWSLLGFESARPLNTEGSRRANLTNEGAYGGGYRVLKNIMGLWIIQRVRGEYGGRYSFDELCGAAKRHGDFPSRIDVNDRRFLAPASMTAAIKAYCADTGQRLPEEIGELMCCVYRSLAASYAETVRDLEAVSGRHFRKICIVGGGCKDAYLNELTAESCRKSVAAGPVEATAIGNLLAQMIAKGVIAGKDEARRIVRESFDIETYEVG